MEELNNRQTPKLRFRQQPLKAIESDSKQTQQVQRIPSGSKNTVALPRLESRAATQSLIMKDVDKEMNQLEVNSRVRDLEVMMIDFKANIERRIQKTIEDNPQKYMQSFKQLEQQEMQLWKQVNDKQTILQDQVHQLRIQGEKNRDALTQTILEVQKRLNDQELKLSGVSNQYEGIEMKMNVSKPQSIPMPMNNDLEVRLLREAFNNEKAHRDALMDDLQRQWQDAHQRLVKQESDFYSKIKQQREEFSEQNEKTRQSIKTLDNMKLAKINQDQDYIKNLIGSVESRIADEVEKRLRSEFDQRNTLEVKLQAFKEEIRNDEKQILLGEQKFMKQMHDSVTSLNQIIKNTKEQLEANLAASQTIVTENIKSISKTVEMIRESSLAKVSLIEQAQKELNFRVGETRQMMHEHANLINNSLQKEFKKQDDKMENFDQQLQKAVEAQNKLLHDERQLNEDWKKQFSQKNLVIFTEVSANLKNIKSEQVKEKTEHTESLKKISQEIDIHNNKYMQLLQNLDQKVTQGLQSQEFKLNQSRKDLLEIINNLEIQINTDIYNKLNQVLAKAKEDAQQLVFESSQQINERITREMEMAEQQTNNKIEEQQIQLKKLIREREEFILQRLQTMIDEEKELRQRLQELIEKYADMIRKFKEDLDYELQTMRSDFETKLNESVATLQRDYSEKFKEMDRYFRQEVLNVELKVQQKLDVLSVVIQKQLETLKEYIQLVEKNVKSYVQQQLEQQKYEMKSLIKEIENDLFKLRVWTLQQVEMMNQSMQEIHIQVQSELYMDRMFTMTMIEQFQDHMLTLLNKEKQDRMQWQFMMENQMNQLDMSLNSKIDTVQNTLQQQLDDVSSEFKQSIENLSTQMNEQFDKLTQETTEKLEKLHQQVKQDAENLENKLTQRLEDLDLEIKTKISEFQQQVEKQFEDLSAKIKQDLEDLLNELNEKISALRKDTQTGLNSAVKLLVANDDELKKQIDQTHAFTNSRFYIIEQLRQANEELDKERHTGIIGKLQELVQEMHRLEEKKNKIKKDLNEFVKGVQSNFDNITDAIKAHGQFLNEIDAKMTMEFMIQSTMIEAVDFQIQQNLVSINSGDEKLKELEEKITTLDKTVHDQIETIQVDQEEVNTKLEKEVKGHTQELELQEEQLKVHDEQLKLQIMQHLQLQGNLEMVKTMTGAMEMNLSTYVRSQISQTLELISKANKASLNNLIQIEKNMNVAVQLELGGALKEIQSLNIAKDKLIEDIDKLVTDMGLLKDETDVQFEKVESKINDLGNQQGNGVRQAEDLSQEMGNYRAMIDGVQKDLKEEIARLQDQIDSLSQSFASIKQPQQGGQTSAVASLNANEIDGKIQKVKIEFETQISDMEQELQKQFETYEEQFTSLNKQIKALQTQKPAQSPISQQNNNKNNNSQLNDQVEALVGEINRIDKDIAQLKKQITQSQPGTKGQTGSTQDIQDLRKDIDEFEENIHQEFQKVKMEVEAIKKNQGKGGAPTEGFVSSDEFEKLMATMEEEFNKFEDRIQKLEQLNVSGVKGGATPTKDSSQDIKTLKDEIAGIKKQLASGGGGTGVSKLTEQKVGQIEQSIIDINQQIKDIELELQDMGEALEKLGA